MLKQTIFPPEFQVWFEQNYDSIESQIQENLKTKCLPPPFKAELVDATVEDFTITVLKKKKWKALMHVKLVQDEHELFALMTVERLLKSKNPVVRFHYYSEVLTLTDVEVKDIEYRMMSRNNSLILGALYIRHVPPQGTELYRQEWIYHMPICGFTSSSKTIVIFPNPNETPIYIENKIPERWLKTLEKK